MSYSRFYRIYCIKYVGNINKIFLKEKKIQKVKPSGFLSGFNIKRTSYFIMNKSSESPEITNLISSEILDKPETDETTESPDIDDLIKSIKKISFTENEQSHYKGSFKPKFSSPTEEYDWAKTQFKTCNACEEKLPLINYNFNTSGKDPFDKNGHRLRRGECDKCSKKISLGKAEAKKLAKKLNIPYKAPEGACCEICGKTEKLVFDHDHEKNIFRGWLCNGCNRSIGMIGEKNLQKALDYIKR